MNEKLAGSRGEQGDALRVSLVGIKSAFGERVIQNEEIEQKYGLPAGWVHEKTGKEKGHAWGGGEDQPIEASMRCFKQLIEESGIPVDEIRGVFGTTNPLIIDGEPLDESLTLTFAKRAGLSDRYISDKTWGCGGSSAGIVDMKKWLEEQPRGTYAIYVTQDWPTKMVKDRNVEAIFSDAVCVSLWTNGEKGIYEVTDAIALDADVDESLKIVGGYWEMSGKAVYEFIEDVPKIVAERLGIDLSEYDIVPHQPNAKVLESLEKIYNVHFNKNVAVKHGNPTCSGAFIALEDYLNIDKKSGKDILVMPFGAGGYGGFVLRSKQVSHILDASKQAREGKVYKGDLEDILDARKGA